MIIFIKFHEDWAKIVDFFNNEQKSKVLLSYEKYALVRFVDFGQMNEFMVQNSSPTCQHNLFTLIQIKKIFLST